MNQTPDPQHYPDDEIDLRELFATLWRGEWIIILVTIVFAAGGVFFALSKPDIYQSSVLLAPTQDEGGAGGLSGQLGGLASLAGISLGGGGANQTAMAKAVLQSRAFLAGFIDRHNLSIPLMATKAWDMVKKFKGGYLSLTDDKETGMVTLNIKSQSPPVAKEWAEKLVHDINEHMREQDVKEAEARIAYLEGKLQETNIAGMQQVFYQLIESETRTVMLANAQDEYVFKTVDPAVAPQEKNEPKRALIAVIATMLGGMLSIFIVFIRSFVKSSREHDDTIDS
jgi:uncharacterized protein involved in exopolysaccharide biosynthesis